MGWLTFLEGKAVDVPTPGTGKVSLYVESTTDEPSYKTDDGTAHTLKGATGATGPAGSDGADGAAATVGVDSTVTGSPGTNASVTNVGTSSAASFKFTIPRGDVGATGTDGTDGSDGAAATIAVGTTTTGAPGTDADVSNSGTSSAAVFDFTIPKGAKGDTGATGSKGDTGATGAAGADGHILPLSALGSVTGSVAIDLSTAKVFTATLTGDVTFSFTNLPAAGEMFDIVLMVLQDATGGHTMTWPANTKWPGGLAYTTDAANVESSIGLLIDSAGIVHAYPSEDMS